MFTKVYSKYIYFFYRCIAKKKKEINNNEKLLTNFKNKSFWGCKEDFYVEVYSDAISK